MAVNFEAIRFPLRLPGVPSEDIEDYEFLVQVMLPDGSTDKGEIEINGDTLKVQYVPNQAGQHSLEVHADGTSLCPLQHFMVREDGSCRRIQSASPKKARPGSAGSNRSTGEEGNGSGGRLSRTGSDASRSSRLSSNSSLERFGGAATRYSVANSPADSDRVSRNSSFSGETSDGDTEQGDEYSEDGPDEDQYSEEGDDDVYEEDEDDDAQEYDKPVDTYKPLKKFAPPGRTVVAQGATSRSKQSTGVRMQQRSFSTSAIGMQQPGTGDKKSKQKATEIFTSASGHMFVFVNGEAQQMQQLGQSSSGDALAQTGDGGMWLINGNTAVPFQPAGTPASADPFGEEPSGKLRCVMCHIKLKKKNGRARVDQSMFCKKHFKKLFSRRPAFEHKNYLQGPLLAAPWSDLPIPIANLTGLGFKEYHKAQREFGKYDPGGTLAISTGVLKALLSNRLRSHPIKESKVRSYFMTPRFEKTVRDLGLHRSDVITELQFVNLLAMIIREVSHKWMRKVSMDMKPMQTSWSTSNLVEMGHGASTFSRQHIPYDGRMATFGLTPGRSGYNPTGNRHHVAMPSMTQSASHGRIPAQQAPVRAAPQKVKRQQQQLPVREDPEGSEEDYEQDDNLYAQPLETMPSTIFEDEEGSDGDMTAVERINPLYGRGTYEMVDDRGRTEHPYSEIKHKGKRGIVKEPQYAVPHKHRKASGERRRGSEEDPQYDRLKYGNDDEDGDGDDFEDEAHGYARLNRKALAAALDDGDKDDDDEDDDADNDEDDDDDEEDEPTEIPLSGDKISDSWMLY